MIGNQSLLRNELVMLILRQNRMELET